MATTIYLSVRGDGAWRVLESFRRALGEEAGTLVIQPNRDESGFYGSAEVSDPAAAREAFTSARQPYPGLKAHLSAPPPEGEGGYRQPHPPQRPPGQRPAEHGDRGPRQGQGPPGHQGRQDHGPRDHRRRDRGRRRPSR